MTGFRSTRTQRWMYTIHDKSAPSYSSLTFPPSSSLAAYSCPTLTPYLVFIPFEMCYSSPIQQYFISARTLTCTISPNSTIQSFSLLFFHLPFILLLFHICISFSNTKLDLPASIDLLTLFPFLTSFTSLTSLDSLTSLPPHFRYIPTSNSRS